MKRTVGEWRPSRTRSKINRYSVCLHFILSFFQCEQAAYSNPASMNMQCEVRATANCKRVESGKINGVTCFHCPDFDFYCASESERWPHGGVTNKRGVRRKLALSTKISRTSSQSSNRQFLKLPSHTPKCWRKILRSEDKKWESHKKEKTEYSRGAR